MVRHEGGGKEKEGSVRDDGERRKRRREKGSRSREGNGWSELMSVHTTSDLGTSTSGQEVSDCTILNKGC